MFTDQEAYPETVVQLRMRIIKDLESGKRIGQIAKESKASRNTIRRIWRRDQEEGPWVKSNVKLTHDRVGMKGKRRFCGFGRSMDVRKS